MKRGRVNSLQKAANELRSVFQPPAPVDQMTHTTPTQKNITGVSMDEFISSMTGGKYKRMHDKCIINSPMLLPHHNDQNAHANLPLLSDDRIILQVVDPNDSDYIHATSLSRGPSTPPYVIAAAPMINTVESFWRMIWQESIHTIVHISLMDENDISYPFYPLREGRTEKIGKGNRVFIIKCKSKTTTTEDGEEIHTLYTLDATLKENKNNFSRSIFVFHYQQWGPASSSVPRIPELVPFIRKVWKNYDDTTQQHNADYKPVNANLKCIHPVSDPSLLICDSDGHRRSATYCAIDMCCRQVASSAALFDALRCTLRLRRRIYSSMIVRPHYALIYLSTFKMAEDKGLVDFTNDQKMKDILQGANDFIANKGSDEEFIVFVPKAQPSKAKITSDPQALERLIQMRNKTSANFLRKITMTRVKSLPNQQDDAPANLGILPRSLRARKSRRSKKEKKSKNSKKEKK